MNVLSNDKRVAIIGALTEGNSFRSIERMTGVHRDTIMRLSVQVGQGCAKLLNEKMRGLDCNRIEVDEIWQFVGKKQKNTTDEDRANGLGDTWTFLSIDPETKLMPTYLCGGRHKGNAVLFLEDLASRLRNRIQLSTDGMNGYADAVEWVWGTEVDYAQIVKIYEVPTREEHRRYSPPQIVKEVKTDVKMGNPDPEHICTSIIERANNTMRQHCKRLARLTLAFSKKPENFRAAIALQLAAYNFVKFHGTIKCTPCMAAGIENSPWSIAELIDAALP